MEKKTLKNVLSESTQANTSYVSSSKCCAKAQCNVCPKNSLAMFHRTMSFCVNSKALANCGFITSHMSGRNSETNGLTD